MKKIISLLFIGLGLLSCDKEKNRSILLNEITQYYQYNIPDKDKQICFYLGPVSFPYQSQNLIYPEFPRFKVWTNNELNRRLDVFTQLSLLEKSPSEDVTKYSLTAEGESYFREGKFCFGQIEYLQIFEPQSKAAQTAIRGEYQFSHIPTWVTSEIFRNYFYRYRSNFIHYPDFKENGIESFYLSVSKLRNGSYILDDKSKILSNVTGSYYPKKNYQPAQESFAYYDEEIAKELVHYSVNSDSTKFYWGDEDPIIVADVAMPAKVAKANNIILMPTNVEQLISQNEIHTIKVTAQGLNKPSGMRLKKLTATLSKDGCLEQYEIVYENSPQTITFSLKKRQDIEKDSIYWSLEKKFGSYGHLQEWTNFVYNTNSSKQIVNISSPKFTPRDSDTNNVYDKQQHLVQYGNTNINYKDDNLVSTIDANSKQELTYDVNNRLVTTVDYIKNKNKFVAYNTCHFSNYNERGDWMVEICDGQKFNRTITYYE